MLQAQGLGSGAAAAASFETRERNRRKDPAFPAKTPLPLLQVKPDSQERGDGPPPASGTRQHKASRCGPFVWWLSGGRRGSPPGKLGALQSPPVADRLAQKASAGEGARRGAGCSLQSTVRFPLAVTLRACLFCFHVIFWHRLETNG